MSTFKSWGRYPDVSQIGHPMMWRTEVHESLAEVLKKVDVTLPYGCGRSYGDSCLSASGHVLTARGLRKYINFDPATGHLEAEAGVTLGEILDLVVPKGWFLPVTPGTKYVTLGGAVANDVHGKNHHKRGSFGCNIIGFNLYRSDMGYIHCSTEEHRELFEATIGGLGLTGIIVSVSLQMMPIETSLIGVETKRFLDLSEFFCLSRVYDNQYEYAVAWIDCVATGRSRGRGVYMLGRHLLSGDLNLPSRKKLSVPVTPPMSLINPLSLKIFNEIYFRRQPQSWRHGVVDYDSFFYPLDALLNWNRVYGKKGFQQFQCVIPDEYAEPAMEALLDEISRSRLGSFLAVLKRCGGLVSPGLMSFPLKGTSLALDFPSHRSLENLFLRLDEVVVKYGGRLYPAKDAHMKAADFQKFYPNWWRVGELRDPALNSRFWQRVTEV